MPKKNEPVIQKEPDENDSCEPETGATDPEAKEQESENLPDAPSDSEDAPAMKENDPFELVPLLVERDPSDDNTNMVIGINGKNYVMPRGKVSDVPRCVYDEYQRAKAAQYKADATIAELSGIKAAQN